MTARPRLGASLITLLVTAAALLVPAPPASAAPVLSMAPDLPTNYPRQVPPSATGQTTRISVVVTSSEPVTVTAYSDDDSLTIADPQRSFDTLNEPTTVSFDVAALAPGMHSLSIQMDGSTGPPYSSVYVGFPFLWTSGSALSPGTGGLRLTSYGWQGTERVAGRDSPTRAVRMLTIVDEKFAYVGLPAFGRPKCTAEGHGCLPYAFDGKTGLLQVGTSIIGRPHGLQTGAYLDGLVPAADGEPYGRYDFAGDDVLLRAHSPLTGTYKYSSSDYPSGLTYQKVTFRKDRSYSLAYAYDGGEVKKLAGRFRLGNNGKITFRSSQGKVVQRGTVLREGRTAACVVKQTCLRAGGGPYDRGIWLILSGRKGKHPDGNLLPQVH